MKKTVLVLLSLLAPALAQAGAWGLGTGAASQDVAIASSSVSAVTVTTGSVTAFQGGGAWDISKSTIGVRNASGVLINPQTNETGIVISTTLASINSTNVGISTTATAINAALSQINTNITNGNLRGAVTIAGSTVPVQQFGTWTMGISSGANTASVTGGRLDVNATLVTGSTQNAQIVFGGNIAQVDASGNLHVVTPTPAAPIGTVAVSTSAQTTLASGVSIDTNYTITTPKLLTLQRLSGGCQRGTASPGGTGAKVELFYDPAGTGVGMTLIDVIYCDGSSTKYDESFTTAAGNGTRRLKMRRTSVAGNGNAEIFGKWDGYEQ